MEAKNVKSLLSQIKNDKSLEDSLKNDPITFLENVKEPSPMSRTPVFLTIVAIVGAVLIASIVMGSIIIFNAENKESAQVPQFLVAIGSTAMGALVGLLAPTPDTGN